METLYKRTRTGAIQYWKVDVLPLTDGAQIVKESGQLGTTNPTVHRESITKGKNIGKANETRPSEQAVMDAQSDWKRKHDEGYKSLADLGLEMPEEAAVVGPLSWMISNLDATLPQFNTDAKGNVKPMLAKDWDGGKKVKYPCYIQPKLDGVRCLMIKQGGLITFLSRSGKEYTTLGHIAGSVVIRTEIEEQDFILDGEIYSDELTFQEITQAVKKQYPNSLKLLFRAYDLVNDEFQVIRLGQLKYLVPSIASPFIHVVPDHIATNQEDVKRMHDEWVQEGYEGAMIRNEGGIYAQGQRSSDLLKVKEFQETEYAFLRFEFGQRGVEDLIAVCVAGNYKEFRAKMQGNKVWKEQLYKDMDTLEGKSLTIKHFSYTDDGLPRFPIGKAFRNYE